MFVTPSDVADIGYRMFNPDGSEAEMCGNGIRCFGDFVYRKGILKQEKMTVETKSGIKTIEITLENDEPVLFTWGHLLLKLLKFQWHLTWMNF